jgi:hypothetical protein
MRRAIIRAQRIPAPAAATGLFFLLAAVFFDRVLFRGEVFFSRDIAPFFYPMKHFLAAAVRAGDFPLWNPWVAGGEPFFASLQPGVLYPGNLVLYVLPMPAAFDILVALHYPLAGLGMTLLLRAWRHTWPGALVGGVAFMLGGYFASIGNFVNNLQTVAWLPWLFLTWDRFLVRRRVRDALVFALLSGVAFLGGEPQMLGLGLAVVFLHGLLRIEDRDLARSHQALAFGVAGVLAVGLVAVQFLPFAEYIGQSVRTLPIDLEYASARSLEPAGAFGFFVPPALRAGAHGFTTRYVASSEVPWLLSIYMGALVLALAAAGWTAPRTRRWAAFWAAAAILGVALAFGGNSPVYRLLFEGLPAFRPFRYPEKLLLLTALALPVVAARGADLWVGSGGRAAGRSSAAWIPIIASAILYSVLTLILTLSGGALDRACGSWLGPALLCDDPATGQRLYAAAVARISAVLMALAVVTWLLGHGRVRPWLASTLLVTLVAADLGLAHRAVNPSVESRVYVDPPWTARELDGLMTDRQAHRFRGSPHMAAMGSIVMVHGAWELTNMYMDYQTMGPNVGQLFGFPMQDGLQGVELISVALTNEAAMRAWSDNPLHFLRAMNVRFYADATAAADSVPGLRLAAAHPELPIRIHEVPDPVPRLYLTGRVEVAEDQPKALRRLLDDDFPLGEAVVLETGAPDTDPAATGRVLDRTDGMNRLGARVSADGPMMLVLSDRYYPGWKATVDGSEAPVLRANGVFRAVPVPGGVSDVEFRFAPRSVWWGGWISIAALLAFTLTWSMAGVRKL